jgi:hypothetical protein
MLLDKPIRTYLAIVFEIPMTGVREIIDDRIICDGHSNADLMAVTLDKMIAYIGSEETFPRAWELTCMKAKSDLNPPVNLPPVIQMADEPKEIFTEEGQEKIAEKAAEIYKEETKTKTHENKKSK